VANLDSGFPADVSIGDNVTIGHGALLTSCVIGDRVLVGQGSIIQEGCEVENDVIIAAGAVVLPGTLIPSGQLWAGNPAKVIRPLSEQEMANFVKVDNVDRLPNCVLLLIFSPFLHSSLLVSMKTSLANILPSFCRLELCISMLKK
jgi:hypothetical protein